MQKAARSSSLSNQINLEGQLEVEINWSVVQYIGEAREKLKCSSIFFSLRCSAV